MTLLFAAPALPLHTAGPYVAAAYVVFVAVILIYVAIMAVRLTRTQRELARLEQEVRAGRASSRGSGDPVSAEPGEEQEMETLA